VSFILSKRFRMPNLHIAITDEYWFNTLRSLGHIDEINFWRPTPRTFQALIPGELFLFKLHYPKNYIVGGGLFATYSELPVSLAWDAFQEKNGTLSLDELKRRISAYRNVNFNPIEDFRIGCILLEQPFFLPEDQWFQPPEEMTRNIQTGMSFNTTEEPGKTVLELIRWTQLSARSIREEPARYGEPVLVTPRLGQGTFRIMVTDAYGRRCAISNEKTLPVLDAAHIKPYSNEGQHSIDNGLLLRKDIHTLFDLGYMTVTPEYKIEVSRRIKEEYENGRDYYKYHGSNISLPSNPIYRPSPELLAWHNQTLYKG